MDDLEITRRCAVAMGYECEPWSGATPPLSVSELAARVRFGERWTPYDPLTNDAQAMALVKRKELSIYRTFSMRTGAWEGWGVENKEFGPSLCRADNADLNRAICECVAKMQQAQQSGDSRP